MSLSGCESGEGPAQTTTENSPEGTSTAAAEGQGRSPAEVEELPPWIGRWMLVITEETTDFHPLLIQIAEKDGKKGVRQVDTASMQQFQSWHVNQAVFRDENILLNIETGQVTLNFEGRRHGDVILGGIFPKGEVQVSPARLIKTSATSMSDVETPQITDGTKDLEAALKADDRMAALRKFVEANPDLPLVNTAYFTLLDTAIKNDLPVDEANAIAAKAIQSAQRWGSNLLPDTLFQIAQLTKDSSKYRSIARSSLDKVKSLVGENMPEVYRQRLDLFESQYLLSAEETEQQQQGAEQLSNLLEKRPFEINGWVSLAKHYEDTNQKDKAVDIYARLAVLPGLNRMVQIPTDTDGQTQSPLEKTKALSALDGEALQEKLDQSYEENAFYFVTKSEEKPNLPENRRIPLIELFTGSACPPCVAGDLALGGLEKTFPAPELIAVRYHQHIPRPDPLTNSDGEARFGYYGQGGTPTMRINGRPTDPVGGFVFHAEDHYKNLENQARGLLSMTSPVSIDLKASADGEALKIDVNVNGVSENRDAVKLRVLIVDPLVHFVAPNGIRLHEMVVRDIPTGTDGVAIKGTSGTYNTTRNVAELKKEVLDEIAAFQKNRNFKFDVVPDDFSKLRVVAFVQDDSSQEVLQSAISPVIEFGKAAPAEEKPTEEKPAAEKPAAEKPAE